MTTVEDRARAKRSEIENQRAAIQHKMKELDSLRMRLAALEEQAALLDEVIGADGGGEPDPYDPFDVSGAEPTSNGVRVQIDPQNRLPTPQVAIAKLVADHPEGLTQAEIVDTLVGKVKTSAKNPRAVIRNIVHYMVGRGQLSKNDQELLVPPA